MTTLGIDLASQPQNTAVCVIAWHGDGGAEVRALSRGGWDDAKLGAEIARDHAKVAIDAPFGWPVAFVEAINAHERFEPWPDIPPGHAERRCTDRFVHAETGKLPLSVSTDRIAYCAMRCARLLSGLGVPRDGSGRVVEAYPDAALRQWLPDAWTTTVSYKRAAGRDRRAVLLSALLDGLGPRFALDQREACVESDDCLDALVCALVARAAERGATIAPTERQSRLARIEGWIHLPKRDTLAALT